MSFSGAFPYGTGGGEDDFNKPQTPKDVRIAKGRSFIIFLTVNGPVSEILREHVEDVIRVLGLEAQNLLAIIVRNSGTVIDTDLNSLDFTNALAAELTGIATVSITIPNNALSTGNFENSSISLGEIAANAGTSVKIVPGSLTNGDFSAGAAIPFSKLAGVAAAVHNHTFTTYVNKQLYGAGQTAAGTVTCNAGDVVLGCGCDNLSGNDALDGLVPDAVNNTCTCHINDSAAMEVHILCWDVGA